MNEDEKERMHLLQQYTAAYGPLTSEGKFRVDEIIHLAPGKTGEIIWKYVNDQGAVMYIVDDNSGFPSQMTEREIETAW